MRHAIWEFLKGPSIAKSNNTSLKNSVHLAAVALILAAIAGLQSCGIYSMSGIATAAKSIQVDPFYNNTDLGPANLDVLFTNRLKEYYQQNTNPQIRKYGAKLIN